MQGHSSPKAEVRVQMGHRLATGIIRNTSLVFLARCPSDNTQTAPEIHGNFCHPAQVTDEEAGDTQPGLGHAPLLLGIPLKPQHILQRAFRPI